MKVKGPRVIQLYVYDEAAYVCVSNHFPPEKRRVYWIGSSNNGLISGHRTDERGLAKDLGNLADQLKRDNPNLRQVQVLYSPRQTSQVSYVDGYFGRKAIISEAVSLRPLKGHQKRLLKEHIRELKQTGEIPKLLVA